MVQAALSEKGLESTLVTFKTVGDKRLDESLSAIGAKGLFTKELETALLKRKIDLAVHSLKDLPTESPEGLIVAAVLKREDPRDVLVVNGRILAETLEELPPGSRVGTSSLRRRAQLLARRPDLEVAELRGNVPTRLKKVDEGRVHAAILAAAGLHRLGAQQHITSYLDAPAWLPAAGQGAIAVQTRTDDERMRALAEALNDGPNHARRAGGARVPRRARGRMSGADRRVGDRGRRRADAAWIHRGRARHARGARLHRARRERSGAERYSIGESVARRRSVGDPRRVAARESCSVAAAGIG